MTDPPFDPRQSGSSEHSKLKKLGGEDLRRVAQQKISRHLRENLAQLRVFAPPYCKDCCIAVTCSSNPNSQMS